MRRIVFVGISLLLVFLPFFVLWQGESHRVHTGYYHTHPHGGGWIFTSWRMGSGDDYRGNGGGFRGGGPGFRGK